MSVPVLIGLVVAVLAVVFVVAPLIWPTTFGVRMQARPASAAPVAAGDALARLRDDLFTRIVDSTSNRRPASWTKKNITRSASR